MRMHLDEVISLNIKITKYSKIKELFTLSTEKILILTIKPQTFIILIKKLTSNISKNTQYNTYTINTSSQANPPETSSSNPSKFNRMSVYTRNPHLQSGPMEIGTLHETQTNVEKEINFLKSPQNLHYQ